MINYLDKDDLIAINLEAVAISNDPHGVINEANLEYLVDAIQMKYNGKEDELILKAAFNLHYLAAPAHIFIEGNKRTAETSTITFLRLNGMFFEEADQKDLAEFILKVARGEKTITTTTKWLKARVKSIE